ncbi:MAG TPA: glycoside hydrolase [Planctomycetes bacterium]|nr:glycoside hydrolase [Planctomycetota bacterium]
MPADNRFVKGLHVAAPGPADVNAVIPFIRDELAAEGVNTLVMEFHYMYAFESVPELAMPNSVGAAELGRIAEACADSGIRLIPQLNCLGHQSWKEKTFPLLEKHPEFDEAPGTDTASPDFYCRSWCPLHPEVHGVVFLLMDEIAAACKATAFHIGMDEVFIIADNGCPRCKGKDPAELFAGETLVLYKHLAAAGLETWMWGDRFINGALWGISKWDAARNGTHPAVDAVPEDIVVCDWHYSGEPPPATPYFFAGKGFRVVACPWREGNVALAQLEMILDIRGSRNKQFASKGLGMLQTTWCEFRNFIRGYKGELVGDDKAHAQALESAACFKTLFAQMRQLGL